MKLYAISHKAVSEIPEGRTLLGVGQHSIEGIDVYDNTGINISQKNANYCELTALYWIWKNTHDDVVGFEHYRRFFCEEVSDRNAEITVLSADRIRDLLNNYDIILPQKVKTRLTVYNYYKKARTYFSFERAHCIEDLDYCIAAINELYPEYRQSCERVMKSHEACLCNMFVMRKELMDEYCEWLFGIFSAIEDKVDLEHKTPYQRRVFGFLSERLFNVWLDYKNLKYYYAPVYNLHDIPSKMEAKGSGTLRRIKSLFKK